MVTVVRQIGKNIGHAAAIDEAAAVLRGGGLVAFPTETVYGLGANALDAAAVQRIFVAKQRPAWDPLIVHIASWAMLERVAGEISPRTRSLMRAFWPGPLTLLLPKHADVPDAVTAGRPLVGVRWPQDPIALAVIRAADVPVAAPSANLFRHVSPTTAQHVLLDLDGRIDMVLDAGPTELGLESAVLDPNTEPPTLYRPGILSVDQLAAIVGRVHVYKTPTEAGAPESLPSPGMDLRHYAPRAPITLVDSRESLLRTAALEPARSKVGVMLPEDWPAPPNAIVFAWGQWEDAAALAHNLYAGLRWLDEQQVDVLLCPLPPAHIADYAAVRDRLVKATQPE
jgi:L-threonylcarbamoyladenylate synthase